MRSCRASPLRLLRAHAALLALATAACLGPRGPVPAELEPLDPARAPRAALPDDAERAAGRLAALVLAERPDSAVEWLQTLREEEAALLAAGDPPTGLIDNAEDLVSALAGPDRDAARAERLLRRDDLDAELERRLEHSVDEQPMRYARTRLDEERRFKLASVFNRIATPISQLALYGALNPIESTRALLSSLLTAWSFPGTSARERQALRAYEDYLVRYPDGSDAALARKQAARYRARLDAQLHGEALDAAERALRAGAPDRALAQIDHAEAIRPADEASVELRRRAERASEHEAALTRRSLAAAAIDSARGDDAREALHALSVSVLLDSPHVLALRAELSGPSTLPARERLFLAGIDAAARGDEDAFFALLERIRDDDSAPGSHMARHAEALLQDPSRNAYDAWRAARTVERRHKLAWIVLGSRSNGPPRRNLPRPLEYLLDVPGFAVTLVTFPLRLLQYPAMQHRFGMPTIVAGERYLARYPHGVHAEELHRDLEPRDAGIGRLSRALEHQLARDQSDPEVVASYREQIAEQLLEAVVREERDDMKAAIYRSVLTEYGDTPAAERAARELRELIENATPQQIRLSREFLRENPALWAPGALGLRPELMDDEKDNGELAEDGVSLLGRNVVRIELESREPLVRSVPAPNFSRFISLLEEASHRHLATDPREKPEPDPQRDLFFERARLGLLEHADARPAARSQAVFLGSHEKHGPVKAREPLLPIDLVVRGDLETLGFVPVPRIRLPQPSSEAFLYE